MSAGAAMLTRLQAGRLSPSFQKAFDVKAETALTQYVHDYEAKSQGFDVIYLKSTAGPLFSHSYPGFELVCPRVHIDLQLNKPHLHGLQQLKISQLFQLSGCGSHHFILDNLQ